jgi:thiol-disulfide isomerase/thioredoxin
MWFLPLLPSSSLNLTESEVVTELALESSEDEPSASDYFYMNDPEAIDITEFEAPPKGQDNRPDFLYSTNQGIRLVEFYAHWCPHCQVSRPQNHFVCGCGCQLLGRRIPLLGQAHTTVGLIRFPFLSTAFSKALY